MRAARHPPFPGICAGAHDRARATTAREQQLVFLPNFTNYVGAHGDIGLLGTVVQYHPHAAPRGELPRADVAIRFDEYVVVLWHWLEPESAGFAISPAIDQTRHRHLTPPPPTRRLHECAYRVVPRPLPPRHVVEALYSELQKSADGVYRVRTQRGFLNAHTTPSDPFATGDITGTLHDDDTIVALEHLANEAGWWVRHELGWSIARLRTDRWHWLVAAKSKMSATGEEHGTWLGPQSGNARRKFVLLHAPTDAAAASTRAALEKLVAGGSAGALTIPFEQNVERVAETIERIAHVYLKQCPPREETLMSAIEGMGVGDLLKCLDTLAIDRRGAREKSEILALAHEAIAEAYALALASEAASDILRSVPIASLCGAPARMRIEMCRFARVRVRGISAFGMLPDVKWVLPLLSTNVAEDTHWGSFGRFKTVDKGQEVRLSEQLAVQYGWEQIHLPLCPEPDALLPSHIRLAHAATIHVDHPDDAPSRADLPASHVCVAQADADRVVRALLCRLSWPVLRLLFVGMRDAGSPLSRLDGDLARFVGEFVLAEEYQSIAAVQAV